MSQFFYGCEKIIYYIVFFCSRSMGFKVGPVSFSIKHQVCNDEVPIPFKIRSIYLLQSHNHLHHNDEKNPNSQPHLHRHHPVAVLKNCLCLLGLLDVSLLPILASWWINRCQCIDWHLVFSACFFVPSFQCQYQSPRLWLLVHFQKFDLAAIHNF